MIPVAAQGFTALVTFGDSYTDTGNFPSSPPDYWNGRFSNGPLWVEDLSQTLGFVYNPLNNFAVSGSESDELGIAISKFAGTSDSANVLFAIWTGNNDFADHLDLGGDDAAWDTRINRAVSSLMTASDLLYQKGARNIVLFNLIDLTRCPDILNGYSSSFRSYIAGKIQVFNSRLAAAIPNLQSSHPGMVVYLFDTYSDFNYLLDSYGSLGFTKATVGALNDPALTDKSFSGPGANYVFWDSQHPTAKTHALVAQWVANALPSPPPPTIAITAPQDGTQLLAPASLTVDAAVVANGWPISKVVLYENGVVQGQLASAPYAFNVAVGNPGTYQLTAKATYGTGLTVSSQPIQVSALPPPGSPPPAPWRFQDIGDVGVTGSSYFSTNGDFTVTGSGNDIWDTDDSFHFLYQPFVGDGTLVVMVKSMENTDGYAKAGIMFREDLSSGSRNVLVFLTPSSGAGLTDRTVTNAISSYVPGPAVAAPYWLKIQREGSAFTGYVSTNGTQWQHVGTVTMSSPTSILAGLAVTSHNNALSNTAIFSQVQFDRFATQVAPTLAIGRATNGVIQLQLSGPAGANYVCESSSNLVSWVPISTNLNLSGSVVVQPKAPTGGKFFRAFTQP